MQPLITVANDSHLRYAASICVMMEESAKIRGTGIAKRKPTYIMEKMKQGKAVIALDGDLIVGFCYIESWENKKYVANSGLIVHTDYRKSGLARRIKAAVFELSKQLYPQALLFGITTSMAVMKINSDLGYKPVAFVELTQDEQFWKGCQSCVNFDILQRTNRKMCLCTGMLCDFSDLPTTANKNGRSKSWANFKSFIKKRRQRIKNNWSNFPKLITLLKNEKNNHK